MPVIPVRNAAPVQRATTPKHPNGLRPYLFHGVELDWKEGDDNALGDCPLCSRIGRFSVKIESGVFRCFKCGEKGNTYVFLRRLWAESRKSTNLDELSEERGIKEETLRTWGVCISLLTGEYLIPGYSRNGRIGQLYKYTKVKNRFILLATPTLSHQLYGGVLYDPDKPIVYVCEGPWDGMALWEVLRKTRRVGKRLVHTLNPDHSLLTEANVLAVPGCTVFPRKWVSLFEGKTVYLLYDNDHPRKHSKTGVAIPSAGFHGMQLAARTLGKSPKTIKYLQWGEEGYDPDLPSGTDIRDKLKGHESSFVRRIEGLKSVLDLMEEVPVDWLEDRSSDDGSGELTCLPCNDYRTLTMAWRKAMRWTEGLDCALSVMLASIVSVKSVGDQLWIKIIGPAACGKTTLCEAVSVNREYVVPKSMIRGFHSGFRITGKEGEDHSLISKLYDKTLATKDGDSLLQSQNLGQILSEARDLYDGTCRTYYRNEMGKEYNRLRMTWLLCGTSSLRTIDNSELGERFLDCVIMEGIDDELEDEILWRVANRTDRSLAVESDGNTNGQYDPALTKAMELTGGYVGYLRENVSDILPLIESPEWALRQCVGLGKFVAYMRARPSLQQDEFAEREFAARLVSQLIRLARCLAVVMNSKMVDERIMSRVAKVAVDSSRGQTLEISRLLYDKKEGLQAASIGHYLGKTEDKIRKILRFLLQIGVVEQYLEQKRGFGRRVRWKLSGKLRKIMGIEKETTRLRDA